MSAVFGTGYRSGEVSHFGAPLREQRLLAEGRVVADLVATGILTVMGPDAQSWLNSLTTQKLDTLPAGTSSETLVLSPTGHIEHWARVYIEEVAGASSAGKVWLLVDGDPAGLLEFLTSMRFMLRVEITDVSAQYHVVGTVGAGPAGLGSLGEQVIEWNDPWPVVGEGSATYAQLGHPHPGEALDFRLHVLKRPLNVPVGATGSAVSGTHATDTASGSVGGISTHRVGEGERAGGDDLGDKKESIQWVGRDAWEALRIEAWRPSAADLDHKTLVGEIDILRTAVHLAKGCYRGQEAVARVHNLGQVPRRLVFLHLDGTDHAVPSHGDPILGPVRGSEKEVGTVTSATLHYELGPIALGLIKRTVPTDAALTVLADDGATRIAASQDVIVGVSKETFTAPPGRNPAFRR